MNDDFSLIHELIKNKEFYKAISDLINIKNHKINSRYAWDLNHAWYCVADCKYQIGDVHGAISAFRKAFYAASSDIECLLGIGNCYDTLNKPKLADRYFRKALSLNPIGRQKAVALVNLGNALYDQGKWSEALKYFTDISRRKDDIGAVARKNKTLAQAKLKSHNDRRSK